MPKYYCATGQFEAIVNADNIDIAADIATQRLIEEGQDSGLIMSIGETGYNLEKCKFVSMIPLLKKAGVELPLVCNIINLACKLLGKDPKDLDEDLYNWLEGDEEK